MKRTVILALVSACLSSAPSAQATIIGGGVTGGSSFIDGGIFIKLTVPLSNPFGPANSVGEDTFNNSNLYGFDEDQNVLVGPNPLDLDIGFPDPLPVGTEVASHYIFFDPSATQSQLGYVDFDSPILGVLTSTGLLAASDYLANTGVNYLNPALRGLEAGDSVAIDGGNPNRLLVDWTASSPGDYVRVLTQHSPGAVPEGAATLGLLALAIPALITLRKKLGRNA